MFRRPPKQAADGSPAPGEDVPNEGETNWPHKWSHVGAPERVASVYSPQSSCSSLVIGAAAGLLGQHLQNTCEEGRKIERTDRFNGVKFKGLQNQLDSIDYIYLHLRIHFSTHHVPTSAEVDQN